MAKIPVGIRVEEELIERLKNAIWHLGKGLTITSVMVKALEQAIHDLETHNAGKPFPPRQSKIAKSAISKKRNPSSS